MVEHYVHEVFSRIATQGHYVAWISHNYHLFPSRGNPTPRVNTTDGIQIARLGLRAFYRIAAGMVVSRLMKSGRLSGKFDAVVDCVTGHPLPLEDVTDVPVVPLVFNLARKVHASQEPPGPLIAATKAARHQLLLAGFPENYIVHAPYGVDCNLYTPSSDKAASPTAGEGGSSASVVAVDKTPKCLLGALARLQPDGLAPRVDLIGIGKRPVRRRSLRSAFKVRGKVADVVTYRHATDRAERAVLYQGARFGYCGEGFETEALALGACGVPAVCPATPAGKEFVEDGETGLLFQPGNSRELAGCFRRLMKDEVLCRRLATHACERAQATTWNKTASLVLATLENL